MTSRRRAGRLLTLLSLAAIVPAAVAITRAAPADAATIRAHAVSAVRYAEQRGVTSGVAVFDTRTGTLYSAGDATGYFDSASVVKALVATRLLLTGRLTGRTRALAWKMITQSDNDATDELYPQAGGDQLVPLLEKHYGIADIGLPPQSAGAWGTTRLTPAGLARLYGAVREDARVWPWLGDAMHHYERVSSAGEPNGWGVAAAVPTAAVKNGWVTLPDAAGTDRAWINSTGVVQGDRFAVAILTEGPTSNYFRRGEAIVSHEAALLMTGGRLYPPPAITHVSPASGPAAGRARITVRGTGFTHVTGVSVGGRPALGVDVVSPTDLLVRVPAHAAGTVDVRVRTAYGTSERTPSDEYAYKP